ncbi:hypothetical protein AOQ84DRAFT_257261, partial [Glonium stellatum]
YNSQEYADLTITCQGRAFHTHKLVLCSQSDFFAKAEGELYSIDMKDGDLDAVASLLDFFYLRDYKISPPDGPLLFHIKVYALAEKILWDPLKILAENKFEASLASKWDSITFPLAIRFVYDVAPPGQRG